MSRLSKRTREIAKRFDANQLHSLQDAIALLKAMPQVKFDQTVEASFKLGIDSRKSDQNVRGTVSLPSGTGKKTIVLVLAKGDKVKEALNAGADFAGSDDLIEKIASGWTEFDAMVATPDMMREVGKLGKVLGPRGLMPTPKAGTVTTDVAKAVQEIKGGKIEFKSDRSGVVSCPMGKISFSSESIIANFHALVQSIARAKPATSKGQYIERLYLSSTMGPGIKIDLSSLDQSKNELSAKR